jgi:hypothetical protein
MANAMQSAGLVKWRRGENDEIIGQVIELTVEQRLTFQSEATLQADGSVSRPSPDVEKT